MKNILILVGKINNQKKKFLSHMEARLGSKVKITMSDFSDISIVIDQNKISTNINGKPITDFDLVFIRGVGKYSVLASTLVICFKYHGVNFLDSVWGEARSIGNKLTSLVKLASSNLPILKSLFFTGGNIEGNINIIVKELGLPVVAKELTTQRGAGVHKFETKKELADFLRKIKTEEDQFLFQKFEDFDKEFRLLILGDNVAVWETKTITSPNEFRHNVSLGASEEFLDIKHLPEDLRSLATKSAKVLGLQVAGVDIAINRKSGDYRLIEVNRGPGFSYDDEASPEMDVFAEFLERESTK